MAKEGSCKGKRKFKDKKMIREKEQKMRGNEEESQKKASNERARFLNPLRIRTVTGCMEGSAAAPAGSKVR